MFTMLPTYTQQVGSWIKSRRVRGLDDSFIHGNEETAKKLHSTWENQREAGELNSCATEQENSSTT
jgi:hypothetical protein